MAATPSAAPVTPLTDTAYTNPEHCDRTSFALPGTVASGPAVVAGVRNLAVLHPQGRIDVEVAIEGEGQDARIQRAALVRTARKILQGELHIPDYVYSPSDRTP